MKPTKTTILNSKLNTQNSKLKILVVCSINSGKVAPFISDQVEASKSAGLECEYFTIQGKGIKGYLKQKSALIAKIKAFKPDIIHAHYGLSGLLANMQRKIPVITTYHGSDINVSKIFLLSKLNMYLSAFNIFVSEKNLLKANLKKNFSLLPCGVDIEIFKPSDKLNARMQLGFEENQKLVLFAGAFTNKVKNPELAIAAFAKLNDVKLLELKGYNRNEVALLMNAVDACLMTSHTEGSPQFIKEAIACNCPVVSVNVGDVKELIGSVKGCYIVERDKNEISSAINKILEKSERINGCQTIKNKGLDQNNVISGLQNIYNTVLSKKE